MYGEILGYGMSGSVACMHSFCEFFFNVYAFRKKEMLIMSLLLDQTGEEHTMRWQQH